MYLSHYPLYARKAKALGLPVLTEQVWRNFWLNTSLLRAKLLRRAYNSQYMMAKKRGIAWFFNIEEWIKWWESELGPEWFEKRGRSKGQYVMARKGDKGPYRLENVKCVLCTVNSQEVLRPIAENHGFSKLTSKTVLAIYTSKGIKYKDLASQYGIHQRHVAAIRNGEVWRHLTGHPLPPRFRH